MGHIVTPAAEEVLDQIFPVLNHGFVRLEDYMGGDERIVRAARTSFGKVAKTPDEDRRLIHRLMRDVHTSPFEKVIFEFHCKMPIFVARQWVRHRTARISEISGRYTQLKDEFYIPEPDRIQFQSKSNKQGSGDSVPYELQQRVLSLILDDQQAMYSSYEIMLQDNVTKELARMNLPLSIYTEWYWQIDLHNLFHFLKLRLDSHAQYEIRVYCDAMAYITKQVAPVAYDAFEEYKLFAQNLSRTEVNNIKSFLTDLTEGDFIDTVAAKEKAISLLKIFN
jgi:thymidylate synthase (FAD)